MKKIPRDINSAKPQKCYSKRNLLESSLTISTKREPQNHNNRTQNSVSSRKLDHQLKCINLPEVKNYKSVESAKYNSSRLPQCDSNR